MNPEPKEISQSECCIALKAIPDLIFQIKDDGTFINYKGAREDLYVPPEQFIGKKVQEVLPEQLARQTLEYMGLALESRTLQVYEYHLQIGDHLKYFEARMIAYEKDKVIAVVRDITGRQGLEAAVAASRQAEREFSLILDSSPIIVFFKDQAGKFVRVNTAFAEALKISKEEFVGKTVFDLYSPQIAQGMTDDDQKVLKSGQPKLNIIELYESASGKRWVRTDKVPIFDKNKAVIGLVGFAQDITEQKQAEEQIKKAAEEWLTTFNSTKDLFLLLDQDYRIIRSNTAVAAFLKLPEDKIIGHHCFELIHGATQPPPECPLSKLKQSLKHEAAELYMAERGMWVAVSVDPILDEKGALTGVVHIIRDITERKKMELALREKVDELKLINDVAIGRELKLIEREKEVDRLLVELGRAKKYDK